MFPISLSVSIFLPPTRYMTLSIDLIPTHLRAPNYTCTICYYLSIHPSIDLTTYLSAPTCPHVDVCRYLCAHPCTLSFRVIGHLAECIEHLRELPRPGDCCDQGAAEILDSMNSTETYLRIRNTVLRAKPHNQAIEPNFT